MTTNNVAQWLRTHLPDWNRFQTTGANEANTESWVIRPLLTELGWNVNQPDHVFWQFPVGSERVDLALLNDDGTPAALIEVKPISVDLDEEVEREIIDLDKYTRQLSASPCEILVITNGMKSWFFVRFEHRSELRVRRCESATVDLGEVEPDDSTQVQLAASKLELLERSRLLSGDTLQRLRESAEVELAIEAVGDALSSHPVTEAIASEAGVSTDLVRRAMEVVIGDAFDESGGSGSLRLPERSQFDADIDRPLDPHLVKLRRKMTDCTVQAKRFRRRAAKFREIWELLGSREFVPRIKIDECLRTLVESVKARGQFYSAYRGRFGPYLLERVSREGESEDCYKINDHVRDELPTMLRLIDEERNRPEE